MQRTEYEEKLKQLLDENDIYKKLKNDPTVSFQKMNNELVSSWEKAKYITTYETKELKINNALPPKIYGMPKLHKANIPLRPIVSCIQGPVYGLSKFLAGSLSNIAGENQYSIKNSFELKKFIDKVTVPSDHILVSLDVISMYTNIPINLANEIVRDRWEELSQFTKLPLQEFERGIGVALSTNYFQFRDKFYNQTHGLAMGAPISSVIAQLVLERLEEDVIADLDFQPLFFKRYVDDCIVCIPRDKIDYILMKFNSYHPSIQFTVETEKYSTINFLDMTLIRNKNKILTKYFQKPTASGRYVNFFSTQPLAHKKNTVTALADRIINLTNPQFRKEVCNKVKRLLINNNYPPQFINSIFKKSLFRHYNSNKFKNKVEKTNQIIKYVPLPYVKGLSEGINNILKPYKFQVAHKNQNKLSFLKTTLKDKVPKNKQTHVIYQIQCKDCEGVYIGQTLQHLSSRINGHKYSKNSTALKKHELNKRHTFDFTDVKILDKEYNLKARNILELLHIRNNNNAVNDRTEIKYLSTAYHACL